MEEVEIRLSKMSDANAMEVWFEDESIRTNFPMINSLEYKDAAVRWVSFSRYKSSLTAVCGDQVVGISTLYLQPYRRQMHQCEMGIIVDPEFRGKGIGTKLLKELFKMAKETFKLEVVHLQVYDKNPAIRLYERFGFVSFGHQKTWMKDAECKEYLGRVLMEKNLLEEDSKSE